MAIVQLGFFLATLVTVSSDLIDSARSWWNNKKTKWQSRRAQSRRVRSRRAQVESRTQAEPGKTRTKCRRTTTIKKTSTTDTSKELTTRSFQFQDFEFTTLLGKGNYGKVFLAKDAKRGKHYALKVLNKGKVLDNDFMEEVTTERNVLALGSSFPYLTHLHSTFTTPSHLFFVMEYLNGGDLFHHLELSYLFDLDRARFYAAEISAALQFLHKNGIIHRDLKPENVLLDSEGHCKLSDFGICEENIIPGVKMADTFSGTREYMAPEIFLMKKYAFSVDWWSYGVLCYEMITGTLPFMPEQQDVKWCILNEHLNFPTHLDSVTVHFLETLLERSPEFRLGCMEDTNPIRKHPFFESINWTKLDKKELIPPFKPQVLSESDSSNFDSDFTTQPARLTIPDPALVESFNQEEFSDFTISCPLYHSSS